MNENTLNAKKEFLRIFKSTIMRDGAEDLLKFLEKSDFFTAPASTRFHLSEEGGLCQHSLHVYERLVALCEMECMVNKNFVRPAPEALAICGLLHDLCKCNFYRQEMRNKKNETTGQWEKVPTYVVEDTLPFGHGEKSVYMLSSFIKLSREEAMAIRWHMGFSDDNFKAGGYTVGNAFEKFPLAVLTHLADLQATYLDEVVTGK